MPRRVLRGVNSPGAKFAARKRAMPGYGRWDTKEPSVLIPESMARELVPPHLHEWAFGDGDQGEIVTGEQTVDEEVAEIEAEVRRQEELYEQRKRTKAVAEHSEVFRLLEDWFDPADWPAWARALLDSKHRMNPQRFALWLFLWRNGMPPQRASHWALYPAASYDKQAHRQVGWLEATAEKMPAYFDKYRTWDMVDQKFC